MAKLVKGSWMHSCAYLEPRSDNPKNPSYGGAQTSGNFAPPDKADDMMVDPYGRPIPETNPYRRGRPSWK